MIRGYLLLEFVAVGCGYLVSPIAPALFFALISDTWADCTVCILESAPDILSPCLLSASVHRLPTSPFPIPPGPGTVTLALHPRFD